MKLVKAEILWSRRCPLACGYCNMKRNKDNTLSVEEWNEGLFALHKLGCTFAAFYGAEPLVEFDKLPSVISFAENVIGMDTTVITSCVAPNMDDKLQKLAAVGLKSLTTSYDIAPHDKHTAAKTNHAIDTLFKFRELVGKDDLRDIAVVVTLHKKNFRFLIDHIKSMTDMGIWTFFDLYHPDRGQPGSKVATGDSELLFTHNEYHELQDILEFAVVMGEAGYLVHGNQAYLNTLFSNGILQNYSWNCADSDLFPSWITVDCDGALLPCDDFSYDLITPPYKLQNIETDFESFCKVQRKLVKQYCPGCAWCTHIQAHAIKAGLMDINDYVHGRK